MRSSCNAPIRPRWRITQTSLTLSALLVLGCEGLSIESVWASTCLSAGLCDPPEKPPLVVDVLCDASVGSSCSRETAGQALEAVLQHVTDRPRSNVRFWFLAKTVADTTVAADKTVPKVTRGSERTRHAREARFVAETRDLFMTAANGDFDSPPIRKSPLVEAISKIGLADSGGLERKIIVISDAREMSQVADFECALLPSNRRFETLLARRGVLTPDLLSKTSIEFAFVRSDPVPVRGCPVRVDREIRIRELWTLALKRAGATRVDFRSGPPVLSDAPTTISPEKEENP
jgi:hypothetical protein